MYALAIVHCKAPEREKRKRYLMVFGVTPEENVYEDRAQKCRAGIHTKNVFDGLASPAKLCNNLFVGQRSCRVALVDRTSWQVNKNALRG